MLPHSKGAVNAAPSRRNLPRKPEPYQNGDDGVEYSGIGDTSRPWSNENRLDSATIIRRNKHILIPNADDLWHDSAAAKLLASFPHSTLWMPAWIACSVRHPNQALLLSWLLNCFGETKKAKTAGRPACRAHAVAEDGSLWWQATRSRIAEETLIDIYAVDRARMTLARQKLIEVHQSATGLLLRPIAKGLIEKYYQATNDPEAEDELKNASPQLEWFASHTREASGRKPLGTSVHDAVMILCDGKVGPALVLSHILYWHSLNDDGRSRARITRHNRLWIARSSRQLGENPGGDEEAMRRHVRWLAVKGYVIPVSRKWCYKRDRDRGRPTLHVRPCPDRIHAELMVRQEEILAAIELKRDYLSPH